MAVLPTGIGPVTGYNIERSLRFNSADSAYLNRTPASAGNRRTFTMNYWLKRAELGTRQVLASAGTGANAGHAIELQADNTLTIYANNTGATITVTTTQVFRDPSAWGMLTIAFDTTQATASNRVKVYWNGTQITAFSTATYPSQNADLEFNNNVPHNIGRREIGTTFYCGLYLAEVNFIDGQALEPSSFGETDSNTGVWKPKAFSGTYGTNGFYLKFADNSGTTSTTLGKDSSGNGNNWTPNNFSVTAGAGNDSLVDSPTSYGTDTGVGGEVRGNYCTLNPLQKNSTVTIANGNLDITTSSDNREVLATLSASAGKWYFEVTFTSQTNAEYIGICDTTYTLFDGSWGSQVRAYISNGNKWNGSSSSYGASYTTNDVIGVAYDIDAGTIVFYKNNSSQGTAFTDLNGKSWRPFINNGISNAVSCNFGQRAFAYTAPSGFKALCTQNLPTPTIGATSTTQANDYFNILLYSGTGSSNAQTGVGFQPDFVWIKGRSGATDHGLYDAVRGVQKQLESNTTTAETTETTGLTAFGTDGFTVGALAQLNTSSATYVAWNWKANGAGSSNTAGTITSTVSASTTSGFSIVTYTGNGTTGATVGHGLGAVPGFIITKKRGTTTGNWQCWHSTFSGTQYITLNATNGTTTLSSVYNATPTLNVIQYGNDSDVNTNGSTYVAYCFAPVAGYSAFGSYTGNGSADGVFVYTGFRPRYVMMKRTDSTSDWAIQDAARNTYNTTNSRVWANSSSAEVTSTYDVDFLSNGFKFRTSSHNESGGTYIYAAFAESPFKYSLAR